LGSNHPIFERKSENTFGGGGVRMSPSALVNPKWRQQFSAETSVSYFLNNTTSLDRKP